MKIRILLSILALSAYGAEHGTHLEPVDGYFSSYTHNHGYHSLVRNLLLQELPQKASAVMVTLPSFHPESAVFLIGNEHAFSVLYRYTSQQIWGSKDPSKIKIVEKTRSIPAALAKAIEQVFALAVSDTRYYKEPLTALDGVSYYFSSFKRGVGLRAGTTWSPGTDTTCGRLVSLGETMERYAEADDVTAKQLEFTLSKILKELNPSS